MHVARLEQGNFKENSSGSEKVPPCKPSAQLRKWRGKKRTRQEVPLLIPRGSTFGSFLTQHISFLQGSKMDPCHAESADFPGFWCGYFDAEWRELLVWWYHLAETSFVRVLVQHCVSDGKILPMYSNFKVLKWFSIVRTMPTPVLCIYCILGRRCIAGIWEWQWADNYCDFIVLTGRQRLGFQRWGAISMWSVDSEMQHEVPKVLCIQKKYV